MRFLLYCPVMFFFCFCCYGQNYTYDKTDFSINKQKTIFPRTIEEDFNPSIISLEAPLPGGNSVKSHLLEQKMKSKEYFKNYKEDGSTPATKSSAFPIIGKSFEPRRYTPGATGETGWPVYGGIPSDNTLAVSNDDIVLLSMNSVLFAYNLKLDTAVFENYQINLRNFVDGSTNSFYFDPKLIYDPQEDRFILVLLKDSDPAENEIIVCFSTTSDPNDPWNIYSIPGNPKNNNRWTDFPAISLTKDKLYCTGNLIVPNEPWQTGFDGSIIWEMDKMAGYQGANSLNAVLYDSITFEQKYVRNLHTVQGADGNADDLFLLSNRNFDISNDTIFFLQLTNGDLSIEPLISNVPYGVPPNARQFDTDTSDPSNGLQTNDARVLGAIMIEDQIQFVGNTINPSTGFSAVYHGVIDDIYSSPVISGKIIGDSIKDFGYPNLAWSGNESCDREVIIGFNHSSFIDYPGVSAIFCNNDRNYSQVLEVKKGYNYVNRLPGGYERWGDYFGMQRKFNEKGETYAFGYMALPNKSNSGFCAELRSPDSTVINIDFTVDSPQNFCDNKVTAIINSGTPPYNFKWNDEDWTDENSIGNLCTNDTISCEVRDSRGCSTTSTFIVPVAPLENGSIYPNPTVDYAAVQFKLEEKSEVTAVLYDNNGRKVKELGTLPAKSGLNEFSFSLIPLSAGSYTLVLSVGETLVGKYKVVKQ